MLSDFNTWALIEDIKMFKAKTLLLIISVLSITGTIFLISAAVLSGIKGDITGTIVNAVCSVMWLISFNIWFVLYLKCEK